jgi:pectinesterase
VKLAAGRSCAGPRLLASLLLTLAMPLASSAGQGAPRYAAIVDARFAGREGDSASGAPIYRSLGSALASLPANGGARAMIFLRNGRYREKLTIDRPRITLRGESRAGTVLTFDAAAGMPAPGGGTYGTRGSYTLRIVAPDFRAEHLTIENGFDYMANAAKAADDTTKLRDAQAVALMLDQGSDRAAFVDVRILGHQDTLFPNAGRSWFHRCEIAGSVDFIFGAGQAVFEECDIVSRDRGSRTNNGYVTAPSTARHEPFGFLFLRCRLQKERSAMAPSSVTLGRPWHPFGDPDAVGSAVFIDSWMDDHIGAKGWERMSSTDSTGARVWWEAESARFFERSTRGPGAASSASRRVLTDSEAARYTKASVLRGWDPTPD